MSDLAPFVAATIRDKVVQDLMDENQNLKEENEELKRKLHERNPRRSIELKIPNGFVIKKSTVRMDKVLLDQRRNISTFALLTEDEPRYFLDQNFRLKHFPALALWIDGACAVRFQDLRFHYSSYRYDIVFNEWSGKYKVAINAKQGQDFKLKIDVINVLPDEHAELLEREDPVDFRPPDNPDSPNRGFPYRQIGDHDRRYIIEDVSHVSHDQEVSVERLMDLLGEKVVCLYFETGRMQCTGEFLNRKLTVPFDHQGHYDSHR